MAAAGVLEAPPVARGVDAGELGLESIQLRGELTELLEHARRLGRRVAGRRHDAGVQTSAKAEPESTMNMRTAVSPPRFTPQGALFAADICRKGGVGEAHARDGTRWTPGSKHKLAESITRFRRGAGRPPGGARPQSSAATKAASGGSAPVDATHEVFDANGDGVIENWSYAHGGDSFETFDPPPSGQVGANTRRVSHTQPDVATRPVHSTDRLTAAGNNTAAAIHKALGAYRSDGMANPPAPTNTAGVAPVTDTTPAPAPVPQSAPPVALPSAGS